MSFWAGNSSVGAYIAYPREAIDRADLQLVEVALVGMGQGESLDSDKPEARVPAVIIHRLHTTFGIQCGHTNVVN